MVASSYGSIYSPQVRMKILAIETSCDDTSVAVIEVSGRITKTGTPNVRVLSSVVSSQTDLHTQYGGIVPNLARREHEKNLPFVLEQVLKKAKCGSVKTHATSKTLESKIQKILTREKGLAEHLIAVTKRLSVPDIDAIAVTNGPGLEPALWVGVNTARALALLWKKPLVAVNHMEGHIAAILLSKNGSPHNKSQISNNKSTSLVKGQKSKVIFPAIALLVSGGHTQIVLTQSWGDYKIIGETRDDAAGEAFDKVARMLDLPYPGGPEISRLAKSAKNNKQNITLPRPMLKSQDYDFSFSGLKTAALYLLRDLRKDKQNIASLKPLIAREFQNAVVDVLVSKTLRAAKEYGAKTIILGGGVAANDALRARFTLDLKVMGNNAPSLFLPEESLTTDNAAMIGAASIFKASQKKFSSPAKLAAKSDLRL